MCTGVISALQETACDYICRNCKVGEAGSAHMQAHAQPQLLEAPVEVHEAQRQPRGYHSHQRACKPNQKPQYGYIIFVFFMAL